MILKALAIALAAVACCSAQATDVSVNPVLLELGADHNSTLLSVSNGSAQAAQFQVKAFSWEVTEEGELKTKPADPSEISVFPPMLSVEPGAIRNVRVTVKAAPGVREQTWRVFVEELPTPHEVSVEHVGASVKVRTRVGVPVFLAPAGMEQTGVRVNSVKFDKGHLVTQVENTGNHRVLIGATDVIWSNKANAPQHATVNGWYLLPGTVRNLTMPRAMGSCPRMPTRISVNVAVEGQPDVKDMVDVTACAD